METLRMEELVAAGTERKVERKWRKRCILVCLLLFAGSNMVGCSGAGSGGSSVARLEAQGESLE